jgi:hypothetical protein
LQLSLPALNLHTDNPRAIGDVLCRKFIRAAEEKLRIAVADNILLDIIRIVVFHLREILEDDCHVHVP